MSPAFPASRAPCIPWLVVPASATPIPPSGVTSPTAPCLWPLLPPCIRTLAIIAAHLGDEGNPPVSDLNCISSAHSLLLGKGTQPQALEKHILCVCVAGGGGGLWGHPSVTPIMSKIMNGTPKLP